MVHESGGVGVRFFKREKVLLKANTEGKVCLTHIFFAARGTRNDIDTIFGVKREVGRNGNRKTAAFQGNMLEEMFAKGRISWARMGLGQGDRDRVWTGERSLIIPRSLCPKVEAHGDGRLQPTNPSRLRPPALWCGPGRGKF